jgi:hypothetical protein
MDPEISNQLIICLKKDFELESNEAILTNDSAMFKKKLTEIIASLLTRISQ